MENYQTLASKNYLDKDFFMSNSDKAVLLVEDDRVDAMTVKRAFKQIKVPNPLFHVENGEEALEFLRDESKPTPMIILLDLNMPKMNGVEFLQVVKNDEELKQIPVIVLTTSKEQQDRVNTFKFSIAGYMIKPVDYQQFVEMVKTIRVYWNMSQLPD